MLTPYEMVMLRMKLDAGDPVDANRAILTLVRHIETLEERLEEVERQLDAKKSSKA